MALPAGFWRSVQMDAPRFHWVRAGDRYPDLTDPDHFIALDGEKQVGVVRLVGCGPDAGSWMWTMLLVHPGPQFPWATSGFEPTRRGATQALVACYGAFRAWFGFED